MVKSQIFTMGASGGFEEVPPVPHLPVGLRVKSFGAGMMDSIWAVCGEETDRGYPIVLMSHFSEEYNHSPFEILDQYSRPLSKKFGIGMYWDDNPEPVIFTPHQVAVAMRRGRILEIYLRNRRAEDAAREAAELKALPERYPHLKPAGDRWDYNAFRANLAADLKHEFPDVKFSIKKHHHESITVSWTDGPTDAEVCSKVTNKWSDHSTDFTGDFRDYDPSLFNRVFGGLNYIFTNREFSGDIKALAEMLPATAHSPYGDRQRDAWRIISNSSFPKGAFNFRIERNEECTCGSLEEFYKVAFDLPEEKEGGLKGVREGALHLIGYSDKCVAVIGDTKAVKDKLKAMGGRFNMKLTCGPGWVFPKNKTEELIRELGCERK